MKKKIFTLAILTALLSALLCIGSLATEPIERYGRSTATGNVAYAYDLIKDGVMADVPLEKIEFESDKKLTIEELRCAYALFSSDYPECFWLGTNYSYAQLQGTNTIVAIEPNYSFKGAELTAARDVLSSEVDKILSKMPQGSDYEKALYLHDAVAACTEYKMVGEHQTAYGALVGKKAVCAGYAAAYQLLLTKAQIPSWTVSGVSYDPNSKEQVPHAWNVVWIGGECLYTDVTWDDQGDELYHSYFNLALSEIEPDHTVNSAVFKLPECNHYGNGYFHKNGNVITDSTTPEQAAKMFDSSVVGIRTAEVLYTGSEGFSKWISKNFEALYFAIGGKPSQDSTYTTSSIGKEVHVSIMGILPAMTNKVTVELGENMHCSGNTTESAKIGESINEILLTANPDSYFPSDYPSYSTDGITVERVSYTEIKVYGTPEKSLTLTLAPAVKKQPEKTPMATFAATGEDSGRLEGLDAGAKYSIDGGAVWAEARGDAVIIESGVNTASGILVMNPGDNATTLDSEIQSISVTKAELIYTAISHSATALGNDGKISGVSNLMEYKTDLGDWTECSSNEITGLAPGNYFVRMKASAASLASKPLTVTVPSHTDASVSDVKIILPGEIFIGGRGEVKFELNPKGAKNKTVYFSSDNPRIISVDALTGKLTCIAPGTATITVTSQNGGFSDSAEIKVSNPHTENAVANAALFIKDNIVYFAAGASAIAVLIILACAAKKKRKK